jgi:NitT/TauT family transport system ATP-binding protein
MAIPLKADPTISGRQGMPEAGEQTRPVIELDKVCVDFNTKEGAMPVARNVSLQIGRGEFVSVIGPSGCGKTTLLNLAAGLLQPNSGTVTFCGRLVDGPNEQVGYLTQDDALLPWRSVLGNVMLPLEIKRVPKAQRIERAGSLLARVGLSRFERHLPSQLSGGMRKRVSLARTLVYEPSTLLLDEPFGALDAQTRALMQRELLKLCEALELTVLLVTHDLNEAIALSDRICVFSSRPASVVDVLRGARRQGRDVFQRTNEDDELYSKLWGLLIQQFNGEAGQQ